MSYDEFRVEQKLDELGHFDTLESLLSQLSYEISHDSQQIIVLILLFIPCAACHIVCQFF